MPRPIPPALVALALLALPLGLGGCVERRIEITSEPSGALVWLNDQQIGRTPTEAGFTYHGVYDLRLELEGYEPLRTEATARPPLYEHAPLDLFAEALPARIDNIQRWHFVLEPSLESTLPKEQLEADLLSRAAGMRGELEATAPAEPDQPGDAPGGEEPPDDE
ncbi:MAG: PEGA domain-containing protein [Phycisphaerales bacterium]|nr:PEGA domain-containing protein [Phycisphaerales bacterium]